MAYGKSKDQFLLKEGIIEIGVWTNPDLIVPGVDPTSSFATAGDLGYFQQGTVNPEVNRTFAEFLAGTPAKKIRKDLIQKEFMLTLTMAQYNTDMLALAQGLDVDTGTYPIAWIGTDEPTQKFNGYLLSTELVDGTPFYIAMWSGKVTSEAVGPVLPGTAHSTYEFKIEAFEHDNFVTTPNDPHNLGAIIMDQS